MLFRETSARNAIKLRLSIISILLFSKNILQGASITLTSQMPWLPFVNAMFTLRKSHVYASQIACLQSSKDGVLAYKHALQRMKKC